jgi:hypothetical protein
MRIHLIWENESKLLYVFPAGMGAVAYEVAGGLYDLVAKPIQRGREEGAVGVAKGVAEGVKAMVARPIKGGGIFIEVGY